MPTMLPPALPTVPQPRQPGKDLEPDAAVAAERQSIPSGAGRRYRCSEQRPGGTVALGYIHTYILGGRYRDAVRSPAALPLPGRACFRSKPGPG